MAVEAGAVAGIAVGPSGNSRSDRRLWRDSHGGGRRSNRSKCPETKLFITHGFNDDVRTNLPKVVVKNPSNC